MSNVNFNQITVSKLFAELRSRGQVFKKAVLLLYRSRSLTVFGLRVAFRLFSKQEDVPFYYKIFFPKATAWFQLNTAVMYKEQNDVLEAVRKLTHYDRIFFKYNLVEFNTDFLIRKVEDSNPTAFRLIVQKKINEYKKDSSIYEIHNSYFLKKPPRLNYHIDSKLFLCLLPINYNYRTNNPVARLPDYQHKFQTPMTLNGFMRQQYSYHLDGEMLWSLDHVKLIKGYQLINETEYISYEKAADPIHKFIAGYHEATPSYVLLDSIPYVKISISDYKFVELPDVFLLSGRCTRNYFHWLVEYMPKLLWLLRSEIGELKEFPIAIDALMPTQHYELIKYFMDKAGLNNQIIRINPDQNIYKLNKVYVGTNPTFIADSLEEFTLQDSSVLNIETLADFRSKIVENLQNKHSRKIYLARTNHLNRKLVNEAEIINLFTQKGFEIVYPEKLTFVEQLNLFNSAKYIAGPAGAGFSNVIFCQPETIIINFMAEQNKEAALFSNLATISGSKYYLQTGPLLKQRDLFNDEVSWRFSDFKIDIQDLEKNLKEILSI